MDQKQSISKQEDLSDNSAGNDKYNLSYAQFTSPLPPPEILRMYEDISSGTLDRIMTLTEQQSQHRQKYEMELLKIKEKQIYHNNKSYNLGYLTAFICFLLLLVGAGIFAYSGREIVATACVAVIGAMGIFTGHIKNSSKK